MMHLCITQCTYWTPLAECSTYSASYTFLCFVERGCSICPCRPCFHKTELCLFGGRPVVWNRLPLVLRLLPGVYPDTLTAALLFLSSSSTSKTVLSSRAWAESTSEM